jgi:hypothetical protein
VAFREIVAALPLEPAPYGLLSLRDPTVTDDDRWLAGLTYESLECTAELNLLDICNSAPPYAAHEPTETERNRNYDPFVIEAVDRCSTFGFEARDAEERAVNALEVGTQKMLEAELWTGAIAAANGYASNRFLASPDTVDITPGGTPVKVRYGMALLEQALANCGLGTRGVVHLTTEVGSVLPLKGVGDHLETQLGNYAVVGTGYPGTGPDGTTPTTGQWMYVTGAVEVRLGRSQPVGVHLRQQVDTSVNTWEARAQRAAAVYWSGCCVFGVHVDLALDYA